MGYIILPIRTNQDLNSAADINQLMENIEYIKAQTETNKIILDILTASYSEYYVVSSLQTSPNHGRLNYRTSDNKLFKYNAVTSTWVEIDWVNAIKATPEWIAGKLRVNNGILQITPNSGTNWYDCYPAIGSEQIKITSESYKYYMLPCTSVILQNANSLPIVFAKELETIYSIQFAMHYNADVTQRLILSNTTRTCGEAKYYRDGSQLSSSASSSETSLYICAIRPPSYKTHGETVIIISGTTNQVAAITNHQYTYMGVGMLTNETHASLSSLDYYLGVLTYNVTNYIIIRR